MLRVGNNSLISDRARKAANSRRGRRRKRRGRAVYQIEAHTGRVTEWLFTQGLLDLPDNTEASRAQIEEALTRYIGQK
jgi:hypothetical protein